MKLDNKLIAERIVIRNYEIQDKEFCTSMWYDKDNGKYLSDPTEEYVDEVFQNAVDTLQDSEDGFYFVIEDVSDGKRIGSCCAFPNDDGNSIDIGYCINKKFWRNGYATEAVGKLVEWASQQAYKSITAEVAKENEASCGLMKKLGFQVKEETSFKKYHMDITYDSYVFEYII
jgi:ribosomal-protein-alanine N-acetyltransferase